MYRVLLLIVTRVVGLWFEDEESLCPWQEADDSPSEAAQEVRGWLDEHTRWGLDDSDLAIFESSAGGARAATFGHATVRGVQAIVAEWRRRNNGTRLVDLGSGAGHVALLGAVLDDKRIFAGVELAESRFAVAHSALLEFDARWPDLSLRERVLFERRDLLDLSVAAFDAVWVSSLAFGDDIKARLAQKLKRELRPGTVR